MILGGNIVLLAPYLDILWDLCFDGGRTAGATALAFCAALYFGWIRRQHLDFTTPNRQFVGLSGLLVTVLGYVLCVAIDLRVGAGVCATAAIAMQIYLLHGRHALRSFVIPLLLFLLATPIPGFVVDYLTHAILGTLMAVVPTLLSPFVSGPVIHEGYYLYLGDSAVVALVEDCSGLGGMLLFVPLVVVLTEGFKLSLGRAATLLASAVPLAYLASLARILMTGLLANTGWESPVWDTVHEASGVFTLACAMAVLFFVASKLRKRA